MQALHRFLFVLLVLADGLRGSAYSHLRIASNETLHGVLSELVQRHPRFSESGGNTLIYTH